MAALFVLFTNIIPALAEPVDERWSVTGYVGPSTTKFFGAAFQKLNFEPTGVMIGLAADRPFLNLGWDMAFGGEVQVSQYLFGHRNTSFAAGLGIQANSPFGLKGTSLSIYDGPSYGLDPPLTSIGYHNIVYPAWRKKYLNYVSVEFAVALSKSHKWDGVFRLYHRCGMFGLVSDGDDDGVAVGFGIRHNF